ncbi:hypothetical protein E2562_014786 [Oryza meyeriana var. granulata]|uniref:Uncharacterized protein n=1 Tax=Oryza meyeriana var. granulata TaxID=110450 RepID=A0A6G1BXT7_9ORYZ|nr:hypothetical protein E2562_014786 [Oryza meyeriana var. granulata]
MASTPAAGPGGVASPAKAQSSSLPGFHESSRSLRISRPSWIVRTEVSSILPFAPPLLLSCLRCVEHFVGGERRS